MSLIKRILNTIVAMKEIYDDYLLANKGSKKNDRIIIK